MKICMVNSAITWGGGEKWYADTAKVLLDEGFDISILLAPESALADRMELLRAKGLKIHYENIGNLSFLNPIKSRRLKAFFKREAFSHLIINLPSDLKLAAPAAASAGIPNIIYRRGSAIPVKNSAMNRRLFGNYLTALIANSEATKKTVLSKAPDLIGSEKIHVIYNGLDLEAYDKIKSLPLFSKEEGKVRIGTAGRLSPEKGQDLLIKAAALLPEHFEILIAGEGKTEHDLKELARSSGLEKRVRFTGFQSPIRPFMESLDLFVLPSAWEGFGYVLIEAMAVKCPVTGFRVGSIPEVIGEDTEMLIPERSPEALAGTIRNFFEKNEEERRQIGALGRLRTETLFSAEIAKKKLLQLLKEGSI